MKLKDQVAIVTGASKGIGKAIAMRYAIEGARVMLASRSAKLLNEIAEDINDAGGRASAMEVDVCDHHSVEALVRQTVADFGCLDIMVNNAGISQDIIDRGLLEPAAIEKRTPLGRIGRVQDIEGMAVYLAGAEASYITGSVITVDGGWTAYGYL